VRIQDGTAIAADLCRLEAARLAHTPRISLMAAETLTE
jgi:hypothetical protein